MNFSMRFGVVLAAVSLFIATPVFAETAEEIADELNETFFQYNWEEFGNKVGDYFSRDKRFETDFVALGKKAALSAKSIEAMGSYVSHTVVRTDVCGDRLKRIVTVVFAEDGQYYVSYWFTKAEAVWSLSNFSFNGQGSTAKFFEKLSEQLKISC